MATPTGQDAEPELGWGVGSVAARLGIAASTLRTWERRYAVGPSRRTAGGHRRYTEHDIERVLLTQLLIARGAPPSDAARVAHSLDDTDLVAALQTEHGQTELESGDAGQVIAAMVEAARNDDSHRIGRLVADALRGRGLVDAWNEVVAPTLIEIGQEWSDGRLAIEAEHLASEAVVGELRAYTHRLPDVDRSGPVVVVAGAEDDLHSLPLFALEAALAEHGIGSHVLGSQLPAQSLASVAGRLRPSVVFLWASLPRRDHDPVWDVLAGLDDETLVILGGPGWPHGAPPRARPTVVVSTDLRTTVDRIREQVARADVVGP